MGEKARPHLYPVPQDKIPLYRRFIPNRARLAEFVNNIERVIQQRRKDATS